MHALPWSYEDLAQLALAVALGFIIGLERELNHKPAGVRTIIIVTLCGALVMQLGQKLAGLNPGHPGDASRLAAAVVTGIGFLGAGVILRRENHLEGITTAATVWLMSAVGLAVGAAYYVPALFVVLLILFGLSANRLVLRAEAFLRRFGVQRPPRPGPPD